MLALLKRIAKTKAKKATLQLWKTTALASYKELQIEYRLKTFTLTLLRLISG
jgi:hypothetical protein